MADIETKRISELIAAQDIGDTDLFVIEQGGAAKKALGSVVKGSIGGSSLPDGGSNGQVLTKTSSGAEWSDAGTPTQAQTDSAVADWLDAHPEATTTVQDGSITEQKLDPYLTAKVNGVGISNAVKVALLALLEKVAYVDEDGQTYLDALENALYPPANLVSITAVFNQGENTIYDTDSLDTLKQYLTVTATMTDGTTQTVTNYTLSGTLTVGTSTITAAYGGKTDTFDVTVSTESLLPAEYQQVEYIKATGTQHIITDYVLRNSLNDLPHVTFNIDAVCDDWQSNYATNILACFGSGGGAWLGYNNTKKQMAMGTTQGTFFSNDAFVRHSYAYSASSSTGTFTRDDGATISRGLTGVNDVPFELFYYAVSSGTQNDFHFNGKLYSCDVSYDGTKVLDLYPCYRKSDGEVGLYDLVNSRFYTNDGTGAFEKGADV